MAFNCAGRRSKLNDYGEELAAMHHVSEVYSVGGSVDLVAMVRVPTNEDLADLVTKEMVQLDGIIETLYDKLEYRNEEYDEIDASFTEQVEAEIDSLFAD